MLKDPFSEFKKEEESISGLPINMDGFHLFDKDHTSSLPLNLAYLAVKLIEPNKSKDFLRTLRRKTIVETKQATDINVILEVVNDLNINKESFLKAYYFNEVKKMLHDDLSLRNKYQIYFLPSYLIRYKKKGEQRYQCKGCKAIYNLMSSSIFNSIKKDLPTFYNFIVLLTYNVPLDMVEEILCISRPTALLWRHKIFETVDDYQKHTKLSGRVWIDETFVDDPAQLLLNGSIVGLSRNKICIAVGIDAYKHVIAKIIGHGKPSKDEIYETFKDVIDEKSTLVHDADKSHEKLIKTLNLKEELNKSYLYDKQTQENMLMINSLCSWIKRFIYRYAGMKTKNLQRYLNWFVYLFRVKQANEKWPKNERILHHLLLDDSKFVGLYKKKKTI